MGVNWSSVLFPWSLKWCRHQIHRGKWDLKPLSSEKSPTRGRARQRVLATSPSISADKDGCVNDIKPLVPLCCMKWDLGICQKGESHGHFRVGLRKKDHGWLCVLESSPVTMLKIICHVMSCHILARHTPIVKPLLLVLKAEIKM